MSGVSAHGVIIREIRTCGGGHFSCILLCIIFFVVVAGCGGSLELWAVNFGTGGQDWIIIVFRRRQGIAAVELFCEPAVDNLRDMQFMLLVQFVIFVQ